MRKFKPLLVVFVVFFSTAAFSTKSTPESAFSSGTYGTIDGNKVFIPSSSSTHNNPQFKKSTSPSMFVLPSGITQYHTNTIYMAKKADSASGSNGLKPDTLRKVYKIDNPDGKGKTIAIVDAYDDANAKETLDKYSKAVNLPVADFSVVYASGHQPTQNSGWAGEENLDIEAAHAMAPNAKIVLVEADSAENDSLFKAVDVATEIVTKNGGGVVSMSWSGDEAPSNINLNSHFNGSKSVIYVASTGDTGLRSGYPATSPYVIAAGGTKIINQDSSGNITQTAWNHHFEQNEDPLTHQIVKIDVGGNGGVSEIQALPLYQESLKGLLSETDSKYSNKRGTPDLSADADPVSGMAVLDSNGNWLQVGGTSLAAPLIAGIIANANIGDISSQELLTRIYSASGSSWYDITSGENGLNQKARKGYDLVTGLGAPLGVSGLEAKN